MLVKSTRFGDLTIDEKDIVKLSNGLLGFPLEQNFVLLPNRDNSPFTFLQSTTEANLTFLLVDPFAFFHDYEFQLDDDIVQSLGLSPDNLPMVFNIVTVPDSIEKMTANLLAPVVINQQNRQGTQIVLEKSNYTTKHLLFPQGFPPKTGKEDK